MDQQAVVMTGAAALAALVGVLAAWLLMRARFRVQTESAVAFARAEMQAQVVAVQAKADQLEALLKAAQGELDAARAQATGWRNDLDAARDLGAKFEERANRIPGLEERIRQLEAVAAQQEATVLRLTGSESDKASQIRTLLPQVSALEAAVAQLTRELDAANQALQAAGQARAGFESTALRVPGLEAQLKFLEGKLEAAYQDLGVAREATGHATALLDGAKAALDQASRRHAAEQALREAAQDTVLSLTSEVTSLREKLQAEQQSSAEKLDILNKAQDVLTAQFKVLAGDIFEANAKRFSEQNQAGLAQILDPLHQRIIDFKKKVEDVYVEEGKDRSALKAQVQDLVKLNQALSEDAKNLTSALRGSAKAQGNWGELILERVLEASGLRKGEEYVVQDSQTNEDGKRQQPDVVINLPELRKLVVDSKVSLVAYERLASSDQDAERAAALRQHLDSVRSHMKGLSEKRYQNNYGQSLDFVLMFIPIEPAFMVAVTHDQQLFMDAWERNVLLVSPSTLLFVVRTVAHLWRQEAQNRNAQEIAKRGAELYDRLCAFVEDLRSVGDKLMAAQTAYANAERRLSTGKGNVIRQAEMLRELGVKPAKQLNKALVDVALTTQAGSDPGPAAF